MKTPDVYISIGSNVGDRQGFCRSAVEVLDATEGVDLKAASSLYETAPVGGPPQRSFVNLVVRVVTTLEAHDLLEVCQRIEGQLGRERDVKWGPRTIDLDILLYGDEKISEPDLEVPHPRMTERAFVMVPLLEIDPDVTDPWGTPYRDFADEATGEVKFLEFF